MPKKRPASPSPPSATSAWDEVRAARDAAKAAADAAASARAAADAAAEQAAAVNDAAKVAAERSTAAAHTARAAAEQAAAATTTAKAAADKATVTAAAAKMAQDAAAKTAMGHTNKRAKTGGMTEPDIPLGACSLENGWFNAFMQLLVRIPPFVELAQEHLEEDDDIIACGILQFLDNLNRDVTPSTQSVEAINDIAAVLERHNPFTIWQWLLQHLDGLVGPPASLGRRTDEGNPGPFSLLFNHAYKGHTACVYCRKRTVTSWEETARPVLYVEPGAPLFARKAAVTTAQLYHSTHETLVPSSVCRECGLYAYKIQETDKISQGTNLILCLRPDAVQFWDDDAADDRAEVAWSDSSGWSEWSEESEKTEEGDRKLAILVSETIPDATDSSREWRLVGYLLYHPNSEKKGHRRCTAMVRHHGRFWHMNDLDVSEYDSKVNNDLGQFRLDDDHKTPIISHVVYTTHPVDRSTSAARGTPSNNPTCAPEAPAASFDDPQLAPTFLPIRRVWRTGFTNTAGTIPWDDDLAAKHIAQSGHLSIPRDLRTGRYEDAHAVSTMTIKANGAAA